jgi:hypothetical protein
MRNSKILISVGLIGVLLFGGLLSANAHSQMAGLNKILTTLDDSLQQQHNYTKYDMFPSDFQEGDLVFFDTTFPPGRWNVSGYDHVLIYLGNDSFIGTNFDRNTGTSDVCVVGSTDLFRNPHLINPVYGRVINATVEQRHNATEWALSRVGDLYQTWDPRKEADPNAPMITADRWYCSEIVWAAYYHQGIDIDKNGWARDFPWFFPIFSSVSPQDIYDDNDVVPLS